MSLAGSDPSGGAGIQADLKTFTLLGCYGQAIPTALTVQNTVGVQKSEAISARLVYDQAAAVMTDCMPQSLKIGMVSNTPVAEAIVELVRKFNPAYIIYDPVMVSTSGTRLMAEDTVAYVFKNLMPLCTLVTPNLPEARLLSGLADESPEVLAHRMYGDLGGVSVLVKGGHREGNPTDVLYDEKGLQWFEGARIDSPNTHGTGCVLSSAIAAYLAQGSNLPFSIQSAKNFLTHALQKGSEYVMGKGHGPLYLLPE